MPRVDLLIHSAAQVPTCASPTGARRGPALADSGLIAHGAVALSDGVIVAVGPSDELRAGYAAHREIDASGKVICPGFVDCHTHLVFAGSRVDEFERKLAGASYLEILAAGGGILRTMTATRAAPFNHLLAAARSRLDAMLRLGTTTVEIKTGYGLDMDSELTLLRVIGGLAQSHVCDMIPTFLAAHALPPEFSRDSDGYIDLVVEEMLPAAAAWYEQSVFASHQTPFCCDVFCEANAFSLTQARRVLTAGQCCGLSAKIHADEFVNLGGATLAVELGALSADHLDVIPVAEIELLAHSSTTAVLLPAVNFHLRSSHYAPGRALIDAGAVVALATDFNPGSAPCPSLPLVMALACRQMGFSPAEALNACTINAAHALGLGDRLGSLEAGKQADLLILNAPDYRELAYWFGANLVETVVKRGKIVVERA
jgi:imidazolonepropionase